VSPSWPEAVSGQRAHSFSRHHVSAWVGTAFAQDDAGAARKQWRQVADQLRPRVSKLAGLMDNAEADVLAYMGFPAQHRAKIHSTNPLERLNSEIKRRSDVSISSPTRTPSSD
jgi:putative transposase